MFRRQAPALLLLPAILPACTAPPPAHTDRAGDAQPILLTAVMRGDPNPQPAFTLQGLLTTQAGPANAPISASVAIRNADTNDILQVTENLTLTPTNGRFTLTLPLPSTAQSASQLAGTDNIEITMFDDSGDPIGQPIPLTFTPRAWAARYAAELTNSATTELALQPNWIEYGGGYANPTATRAGNLVHLSGLAQYLSGNPTGQTLAILPAPYRPAARHIFNQNADSNVTRVDILPSGHITVITGTSTSWVPLDGITYPAAP